MRRLVQTRLPGFELALALMMDCLARLESVLPTAVAPEAMVTNIASSWRPAAQPKRSKELAGGNGCVMGTRAAEIVSLESQGRTRQKNLRLHQSGTLAQGDCTDQ